MTPESLVTLVAAGLALLASLVATAVSLYTTRFRRFTSQRWWTLKAEAYIRLVEALSDLVEYYEHHYRQRTEGEAPYIGLPEEIHERWKQGKRQVAKATNMGAFLISAAAHAALRDFQAEPNIHPEDIDGLIEHDYDAAKKCIDQIVLAARQDLAVT